MYVDYMSSLIVGYKTIFLNMKTNNNNKELKMGRKMKRWGQRGGCTCVESKVKE